VPRRRHAVARGRRADLPPSLQPEPLDTYLADIERIAARWHDPAPDAMRRVVVAPTTPPHSMRAGELRETAAFARSAACGCIRTCRRPWPTTTPSTDKYRMKPVQFCQSVDWLGPDVWFAHLVKLDADEIALLGATGTGIAHCPQSNGRLGSGIAPVRQLEAAGAGVDRRRRRGLERSGRHALGDACGVADAARACGRSGRGVLPRRPGRSAGRGGRDGRGRGALGHGRRRAVLGLDAVGTLQPGQAADIAIYRLDDDPRYFGLHDPAIGPVASGGAAHLQALLVAGQPVVEHGKLPGVDLKELGRQARREVQRLLASVG
jgi:8-oxoguanine deaminase